LGDGVDCSVLGGSPDDYVEGGKPACPSDCKGQNYGNGTCQLKSEVSTAVNGVESCGSGLVLDAENEKLTATITVEKENSSATAKAAIICSSKTASSVEADISVTELSTVGGDPIVLDLSSKAAGDYLCYVVLTVGEKNESVICPITNGKPSKATGAVASFEGATVEYSVVAAASDIAVWNDFSSVSKESLAAGMKASVGSDADATLKLFVAEEFGSASASKGQNAAGNVQALVLSHMFPDDKPESAKSSTYLTINSSQMAGKHLAIKATTGVKNKDYGHMVVVAGESTLVEDFHAAKSDWKVVEATIPESATEVVIYSYGMKDETSESNLIIDSISITSAE